MPTPTPATSPSPAAAPAPAATTKNTSPSSTPSPFSTSTSASPSPTRSAAAPWKCSPSPWRTSKPPTASPRKCWAAVSTNSLPKEALGLHQVQAVIAVPDVRDPLGIRDRTMLELFYSTGLRRSELARLEIHDLNRERQTLQIRQGKGHKDRVVPVGNRVLAWLERYLDEVRPRLLLDVQQRALFLTSYGDPFNPDVLSRMVSKFIKKAEIERPGSCHLMRHTCATHMLEGGADIRFIQQLLGHEKLETTAIYTQVSIEQLKAVHGKTHPAEKR
ncbi:MAG: tyrosine-type recombinase/integrase [Akkermansiaceae bacterium]|nr:tyrosine-type recombinase/integrase [Akkermansiaceae bacterium]